MASYTDELIQFNPYVSQLPVEAYVNTGMALQQRRDQNVQRVQGIIDYVNGLPVTGDANVAYLKSKISELQSKVQGVVGSDFARGELVTQIGGLAQQIVKDPTIQASVASAQKIKQLEDHANYLRKEKPDMYSEANYQRAMSEVQRYYEASRETAGLAYQGPTNMVAGTEAQVKKLMFDYVKQLDPNIETEIDDNGQVIYKSKNKSLTPEKIKSFVQGQLTADQYQILDNAAWFNFRGLDDAGVASTASKYFEDGESHYQTIAKSYRKYVDETTNLTPQQKHEALNQAAYYEEYAEKYKTQKNNILNGFKSGKFDRDQVTSAFWVNRTLDGFSMQSFSQKEVDVDVSPYLEAAEKLSNIAKNKGKKDGEESSGNITTTGQYIPVNPDQAVGAETNKEVNEEITSLDSGIVNTWDRAIASVFAKQTAGGGMLEATTFTDSDGVEKDVKDSNGNLTKAARDYATKKLVEVDTNYRRNALSDPNAVIPGFNEKDLKNLREVVVSSNAYNQLKKIDDNITKQAKERVKARGINVPEETSYNLNGKTYSIDQLRKIYERDTYKPVKISGKADNVSVDYQVKSGSELSEIGKSKVESILKGTVAYEKTIREEKDRLYGQNATVVQPYMTYTVTSDKDSNLSNNKTLQTAFTQNMDKSKFAMRDGNAFEQFGGKISPDDVEIAGAYWDKGKLFLRGIVKQGSGEKEVVETIDVDITAVRQNYPNNDDWFDKTFVSDSHPGLTESLMRVGSNGKTPLNQRDNFSNSLMVVGPNNISRYFAVEKTTGNKFVVRLAVPTGNKNFSVNTFIPNANNEVAEFENAGLAIQAADAFYKQANATELENIILGNGK